MEEAACIMIQCKYRQYAACRRVWATRKLWEQKKLWAMEVASVTVLQKYMRGHFARILCNQIRNAYIIQIWWRSLCGALKAKAKKSDPNARVRTIVVAPRTIQVCDMETQTAVFDDASDLMDESETYCRLLTPTLYKPLSLTKIWSAPMPQFPSTVSSDTYPPNMMHFEEEEQEETTAQDEREAMLNDILYGPGFVNIPEFLEAMGDHYPQQLSSTTDSAQRIANKNARNSRVRAEKIQKPISKQKPKPGKLPSLTTKPSKSKPSPFTRK